MKNYSVERFLPRGSFAHGVGLLIGGTAVSQILMIAASPILTRIYSPEDFGLLAIYTSILAVLGVASSLRYELAIPIPKDDVDAIHVVYLCIFLTILSSAFVAIVFSYYSDSITDVLNIKNNPHYSYLVASGTLFSGIYMVLSGFAIRSKRFSAVAGSKLWQVSTVLGIQFAAYELGGMALVVGVIVGNLVGAIKLRKYVIIKTEIKILNRKKIELALVRYQKFPRYSVFSGLLNTIGLNLPPLIFAAFYSTNIAGLYALAHKILSLPASLLGRAIGNVFLSHAAELYRKEKLTGFYQSLQDVLIQIGLPITVIILVSGQDIFALLFSERWREAGLIAAWLSLATFASFVVAPLSQIFVILEKQETGLLLQVILFSFRVISILIGVWTGDYILTTIFYSLGSVFGYTIYILVGAKYAGVKFLDIAKSLVISLGYSIVIATPILLLGIHGNEKMLYVGLLLSIIMLTIRYLMIFKTIRTLQP